MSPEAREPYETLAGAYDGLTTDVDYAAVLQFFETVLQRAGHSPKTVLDLACGTGSMSVLLAERGYRVIGADISEEMLTAAAQKAAAMTENPPFFICQPMQRLTLPEPVEAIVCLLDSLNYLTEPEDCRKTFHRVWRAEFDEEENCCYYGIDLFRRRGALWARSFEQHCEYAYDPDTLEQWLREAGFARVECFGDRTLTPPGPDEQRMYFAAWKE